MKEEIIRKITDLIKRPDISEKEILYQLKEIYDTNMRERIPVVDPKSLPELLSGILGNIENDQYQVKVIKTGFSDLDKLIGGFIEGEFVVFGGRPSMGKTQLMIHIALNISLTIPVLFLSYDLTEQIIASRCLSVLTDIETHKILNGCLTDKEKSRLAVESEAFGKYKIFINSFPCSDIDFLKDHCMRQIKENNIQVIVVDYLQALTFDKYRNNREHEIARISRELKTLAREHHVCVIATSALNRSAEYRDGWIGKAVHLSELRNSGSIEQDADKVIFIRRPEYYGIVEDVEGNSLLNVVDVMVAKNRNGVVGNISLKRTPGFTRFMDFNQYDSDVFSFGDRVNEIDIPPF